MSKLSKEELKKLGKITDWDKNVIKVTIPHDGKRSLSEMRLTIVHPFFGEAKRFEIQMNNWLQYPKELRDKLDIIIVDDHGDPSISSLLTASRRKRCPYLNLSIYRIKDDLKWNTPGAFNLGVTQAKTEWVLIMDSDCLANPATLESLMNLKPNDKFYYFFGRNRVTNDPTKSHRHRYHQCVILFSKRMFLDIGGFDEDFTGSRSGGYGFFDNHFDFKAYRDGYNKAVVNIFIEEYMEDAVGLNTQQKANPGDYIKINKSLYRHKQLEDIPENRKILNFEWELVYG